MSKKFLGEVSKSVRKVREEGKGLEMSVFSIRLQIDNTLSLCFAYIVAIAAVMADMTALAIDFSTVGSIELIGIWAVSP